MINSLEQAVQSAKMNNPEGQSFLYEHTYKKAYYVALKFMQNEDEAYDVVQDAYMRAFKSISQLDEWNKFESWLNQIVANTAKNALKKKKPDLFTDIAGDEENDVADRFEANYTQQPEVVMDQNETSRLVQEIISELSDEQRACVMMYYIQELSVKEISETLEVSDNTVKSRLNYARKNIEAKVKELEKKGTKLYALAPIPFFLLLLHTEADACEATAVAGLYSATAGATTATGATAGTASTGAGATAATGAGAAGAGMSLGMKIAIGITAAVVAIGGAIGVGIAVSNNTEDTSINKEADSVGNNQQPEQGKYEEYLATQNVLYGQKIDRELCKMQVNYAARNTLTGYKPAGSYYKVYGRCVYPTGVLGYVVEDVNDDGKDELIQLDLDSNGNVTISEKAKSWGEVKDIAEKRSFSIKGEFNRVAFYTFKSGKDTYLLITSGLNQYLANHAYWRICCYKLEDDKIIPVEDASDSYNFSSEEDEEYSVNVALEVFNRVLGLQGKSMNYNQCLQLLNACDCNIEPYLEAERFILLSADKLYEEMSSNAQQLQSAWGTSSSEYDGYGSGGGPGTQVDESTIIEKAVISSQLITK